MPKLKELREQIDDVDAQIAELLVERANLVLGVKQAKQEEEIDIYSPEREREIIERVLELAKDSEFPKEALQNIFINIVSATRSLIGELRVSYSGPEYSEAGLAARKTFGESVSYQPQGSELAAIEQVLSSNSHFVLLRKDAEYDSANLEVICSDLSEQFLVLGKK